MWNLFLWRLYVSRNGNDIPEVKYLKYFNRIFEFFSGLSFAYLIFTLIANFPLKPFFLLLLLTILFFFVSFILFLWTELIKNLEDKIRHRIFTNKLSELFKCNDDCFFYKDIELVNKYSGNYLIKLKKEFEYRKNNSVIQ